MGKDDAILAQLERLETKVDALSLQMHELAIANGSLKSSVSFLKSIVGALFTALLAFAGLAIKFPRV